MSKATGFINFTYELPPLLDPRQRVKNSKEFVQLFPVEKLHEQSARCMDCGVPFCHNGCPLGNIIPEFNNAVYREDWLEAYRILSATNNFPEFTGRICPAPCESACVLGINQKPVVIEAIEKQIVEIAFQEGYIKPIVIDNLNGKSVAVVGSGPAGLAAAAELNKLGYRVSVYEKNSQAGGLLRYGIPDFKLEKWVIDRRLALMESEGIIFRNNVCIGTDLYMDDLLRDFDAVILAGGCEKPRELAIPGQHLKGVHFAMEFLVQHNQRVANESIAKEEVFATNKNVLVIGSGDTGSDCIGTANRQNAKSITQLALSLQPPVERDIYMPWPIVPKLFTTSTSQEEGCERKWGLMTKEFVGDENGNLVAVKVAETEWDYSNVKKPQCIEKPDSEYCIPCDMALIAIGFSNPIYEGMLEDIGVELDVSGNVLASDKAYQTSIPKIFAAGDMRRGQSLVVWAIHEGRECAKQVHKFLE